MIMGGISLLSSMGGAGGGVAHTPHLGGLVAGYLYLKGGRMHLLSEIQYRYLKWRINRCAASSTSTQAAAPTTSTAECTEAPAVSLARPSSQSCRIGLNTSSSNVSSSASA